MKTTVRNDRKHPPRFRSYSRNLVGRDFAIGDIHGSFGKVEQALHDIQFDTRVDRLFSVGDLVDRGDRSEECLWWLEQPWFHAVAGNHEEITIDYIRGINTDAQCCLATGGAWLVTLPPMARTPFMDAFDALPYAIEVETTHGPVGIIHAEVIGDDWERTKQLLLADQSYLGFAKLRQTLMWERMRISSGDRTSVDNVSALVVGHTPRRQMEVLGNVYYIDTKMWKEGFVTLLDLNTLTPYPANPVKLEW